MLKEQADKMTVQELCDYAVEKIVQQGSRCMEGITGKCAYSDGKGKHCAIGWLLDHDAANWSMLNYGILILCETHTIVKEIPKPIRDNLYIFSALQGFHDKAMKPDRQVFLVKLQEFGIVPNENYYKWIELGEDDA